MFGSLCGGFNPRAAHMRCVVEKGHRKFVSKYFGHCLPVVIPAMLYNSLPQPPRSATGPNNQVLITVVPLSWGFTSDLAPIWCAICHLTENVWVW
jgi:hypothetical protein